MTFTKGPIHAGFECVALIALLASGCAHRSARITKPVAPARIGSTETGIASWYGIPYHGRASASGEIYDMEKLTAAHRTLPFETWVEVTNLSNGKRVDVRINDRGPFIHGRIIDLSQAAARDIEMLGAGTTRVRLKVIRRPSGEPDVKIVPDVKIFDVASRRGVTASSPANPAPANSAPSSPSSPSSPASSSTASSPDYSSSHAASGSSVPLPSTLTPSTVPASNPTPSTTLPSTALPATALPSTTTGSTQKLPPTVAHAYAVQAGAFADRGRAEALSASMSKMFSDSRVILRNGNPPLWRVFVGRVLTLEQATALAPQVKQQTGDASVVPEPFNAAEWPGPTVSPGNNP
jgi:rare lipoprotein A (peptidoglycan hydrolase)